MDYIIYKHIGALSAENNGWAKELNFNREPVYDIRTWNGDHTKYGKGITITVDLLATLKELKIRHH